MTRPVECRMPNAEKAIVFGIWHLAFGITGSVLSVDSVESYSSCRESFLVYLVESIDLGYLLRRA